jgi:hypothetical protein
MMNTIPNSLIAPTILCITGSQISINMQMHITIDESDLSL